MSEQVPVIEIEVDDEDIDAAIKRLSKLQHQLRSLKMNKVEIEEKGFKTLSESKAKQNLQGMNKELEVSKRRVFGLTSAMKGMFSLVSSFAKMTGMGLAAGAGVGTLGLLWLSKSAEKIAEQAYFTRSTFGMAESDLPRLEATFGRFGDVRGMASSIAEQQSSFFSYPFALMDMTQQQAQMKNTEELMWDSLAFARKIAKTPYGLTETNLRAYGLDKLGINLETMRRLRSYSDEEFEGIRGKAEKMTPRTRLKGEEDWQDFAQAVSLGVTEIGVGIKNLVQPILRPLMRLGDATFKSFSKSPIGEALESVVTWFTKELERLAKAFEENDWKTWWDGTKAELKSGFEWVVTELVKLGNSMWDWFKTTFPKESAQVEDFWNSIKRLSVSLMTMADSFDAIMVQLLRWEQIFAVSFGGRQLPETSLSDYRPPEQVTIERGPEGKVDQFKVFATLMAKGVDFQAAKGLLALMRSESSGNVNALNINKNGSKDVGLWQINSRFYKDWGLTDENWQNPEAQTLAVADMWKKYHAQGENMAQFVARYKGVSPTRNPIDYVLKTRAYQANTVGVDSDLMRQPKTAEPDPEYGNVEGLRQIVESIKSELAQKQSATTTIAKPQPYQEPLKIYANGAEVTMTGPKSFGSALGGAR